MTWVRVFLTWVRVVRDIKMTKKKKLYPTVSLIHF